MKLVASFPGPAQLSVASSTEKRERAWNNLSPQNATKSDLRRSEIKNFPGGHVPHVPHLPSTCASHTFHDHSRAHWNSPFQNSRSATGLLTPRISTIMTKQTAMFLFLVMNCKTDQLLLAYVYHFQPLEQHHLFAVLQVPRRWPRHPCDSQL